MSRSSPVNPRRDDAANRDRFPDDDGQRLRPLAATSRGLAREVGAGPPGIRPGSPQSEVSAMHGSAAGQPPFRAGYLPLGPDGRPVSRRAGQPPGSTDDHAGAAHRPGLYEDHFRPSSAASSDVQSRHLGAAVLHIPREHALFCSVLLVAAVVRIIVMLGYLPAMWYPDSLPYIQFAIDPSPYAVRPIGYSFFLTLLEPLHSVAVVTALQHAMGLAIGTLVYALLRVRFRLPAWGATLAAAPSLLSAYAIQIEHFVLSDTFFGLLVTLAVVLVIWRPAPRPWVCGLAGLLLAWAALARSQGLLLAIPFALYLAARLISRDARLRVVVRGILAMSVMVAVPLLGYAWWFDQANGSFELTTSTGAFLYARVAGFADCSVIKPPADEQWLCLHIPVSKRPFTGYYVWAYGSPLYHGPAPEFSSKVSSLSTDFALHAIRAQPMDYLKVVWHATVETFEIHRDATPAGQSQSLYVFPSTQPESLRSLAHANYENYNYGFAYNGNADPSTSLVQPYAGWIAAYQRFIVVPGPLLGVIVLMGMLGIAVAWRRLGGAAILPWLTGVVLIVTPAATSDFDARYIVAAIPSFCIAAAIGLQEILHCIRHSSNASPGNGYSDMAGTYAE
jgi:hypothetical protein